MMIATVIKLDNIAHYFCTHEVRLKKKHRFSFIHLPCPNVWVWEKRVCSSYLLTQAKVMKTLVEPV